MIKAMSTFAYVRERLHPGLLDGLVRAGAEAIEIFAFRGHFDYAQRKQHVLEIAAWFKSTGAQLNSVHSPLYADYEWGRAGAPPLNVASTDRAARVEAMDEIKRALEIAVVGIAVLAADPKVVRVHEHVGTGLELGEAVVVVDIIGAGGTAADDVHGQTGFTRQFRGLANARQVFG